MSILLIVIGAALIFVGWKLILSMNDEKTNRQFESWLSRLMNKDNAKSYRIANGVIFLMGMCFIGFILLTIGSLKLFGSIN
jgi:uncharacterized membrane protein